MIDHQQEEILDDEGKEQGFLSHLFELRDRLLRCILSIVILFACLFAFSEEIYSWLAAPLLSKLPEGSSMIAIDVASPFLTPFKLVLMVSIFLAVPFLLTQIWGFVAPGLYKSEKRLAVPLLVSSILLFYVGVAFAYYVVFPLVFGFFTSVAPAGIEVSTDIARYLDFVITIFFAFGIAFEVPVAVFLMIAIGATTPDALAKKRPYFIVAAFIVGMFLTPPDVISQTLLALPMWLLFEAGIIAARFLLRESSDESETSPDPDPPASPGSTPKPKPGPVSGGSAGSTGVAAVSAGKAVDDKTVTSSNPSDSVVASLDTDYRELTDEEMESELDRMDAEGGRAAQDAIKNATTKKTTAKKKTAKKISARNTTAKKATAKKTTAKKTTAKKTTAKKATAKKTTAKKATAKKATAKKATAKKATAKKATANKVTAKKKPPRIRSKSAAAKSGDSTD
jgi:sec-independent protein translocase protein TatC